MTLCIVFIRYNPHAFKVDGQTRRRPTVNSWCITGLALPRYDQDYAAVPHRIIQLRMT